MNLRDLKYFIAVADAGHFGRAAARCNVSQPTLSVAIRKLEEELGVVLFERGASEIVLTQVGHDVIAQAQQILAGADKLKKIASTNSDPLVEPLKVGVIYTIGPYLLPHLIPSLQDHVPDMPIIVEEGFTADLSVRLKQGKKSQIRVDYFIIYYNNLLFLMQ